MDAKRKGFLVALVVGMLAAPAIGLGATYVFGSDSASAAPATMVAATDTITTGAATRSAKVTGPDLATACGPEAAFLVGGEARGTLSDVQQAALDALRPICAAAGYRLDEPGSGDDAVTGPALLASPGIPSPGGTDEDSQYEDSEYEDSQYEDEDRGNTIEDEDEHEEEHENEPGHEGREVGGED